VAGILLHVKLSGRPELIAPGMLFTTAAPHLGAPGPELIALGVLFRKLTSEMSLAMRARDALIREIAKVPALLVARILFQPSLSETAAPG